MMFGKMDAKKKAIEELMSHLDNHDGKDLGEAMKPKGVGLEAVKVEKLGDDSQPEGSPEEEASESPGMEKAEAVSGQGDAMPKMSDEEIQELIEALQSKLGS